ncbi:hypothetical protein ACLB2K_073056 [Fragaria x ananassa]
MDVFISKLNPTNKRQLRRNLIALSKHVRYMEEIKGEATLFIRTNDNEYLRVNGDPDNPISEVEESNQELLDWKKQHREVKKQKKAVKAIEKEKHEQFEKLKSDLQKYFQQTEKAGSDSTSTSNGECTQQLRDGSATASVSTSPCSGLGR